MKPLSEMPLDDQILLVHGMLTGVQPAKRVPRTIEELQGVLTRTNPNHQPVILKTNSQGDQVGLWADTILLISSFDPDTLEISFGVETERSQPEQVGYHGTTTLDQIWPAIEWIVSSQTMTTEVEMCGWVGKVGDTCAIGGLGD